MKYYKLIDDTFYSRYKKNIIYREDYKDIGAYKPVIYFVKHNPKHWEEVENPILEQFKFGK